MTGLSIAAKTLWKELPGSMAEIAEGVSKLPGNMHKELSGSAAEIVKGLEFGFLAAGWAILEAGWIVLVDVAITMGPGLLVKTVQKAAKLFTVGSRLYKFARPIADPPKEALKYIFIGEQTASAGLTATNATIFYLQGAKETAERISEINNRIKKFVYGSNDKRYSE